jgi:Protein of unknown function (DUF3768)
VSEEKARKIAEQNDLFRTKFYIPYFDLRPAGHMFCTGGIASLSPEMQIRIWMAVAKFTDFPEGDDPYGEHDFGAIDMVGVGEKIFWKIDYYADKSCTSGSEDPSDPARTFRVLTIMLASEW